MRPTAPGLLAPAVRGDPNLVYVPNSDSNTVSVINPRTYKVIDQFPVGINPQHVVPSYDLKTLWVNNDQGNSLTAIDPRTGKPGRTVPVTDPYNLYFTPDGRYAIVVSERRGRLDFRDAHTMKLHHSLPVPCSGPNHMDFTADGRYPAAQLRVRRQGGQGRRREREGRRLDDTRSGRYAPGRQALARRQGSSTSPT